MRKELITVCLVIGSMFTGIAWAEEGAQSAANSSLEALLYQYVWGPGSSSSQGGNANANAGSSAVTGDSKATLDLNFNPVSNYETAHTPPVTSYPPYLPYWNHGGWGTLKAYFPTGLNSDPNVYERRFCVGNPADMQELKGILEELPYKGPLEILGGAFNSVCVLFGAPDNFHHGRGFEITNSLIRQRRPAGKSLLVFIDGNINRQALSSANYVYVGKVSVEGDVVGNNWDHAYNVAAAEALPWDVDILFVSGGMKGVTIGSTNSLGAGGAYTQPNYSLSLIGGNSNGIVEGKGKAQVGAEGYRYWPEGKVRRQLPTGGIVDIIRGIQQRPSQQSGGVQPQAVPVDAEQKVKVQREVIKPVSPISNDNKLRDFFRDLKGRSPGI